MEAKSWLENLRNGRVQWPAYRAGSRRIKPAKRALKWHRLARRSIRLAPDSRTVALRPAQGSYHIAALHHLRIGWIVKECYRAIGQRVSPQANWGLIGLGLAASACLFVTLLR